MARSPLDPLQGVLPTDAAIARMQKHEMKEYIYSLGEQLAAARQALKDPKPPKGYLYISEAEIPWPLLLPLPEGRELGETQRIESIVDTQQAYKTAEIVMKAKISQRLTKS